jgi:hypothetical protein
MPIILALGWQRQEDLKFKASLSSKKTRAWLGTKPPSRRVLV